MLKVLRLLLVLIVIGACAFAVWYWRTSHVTIDPGLLILYGNVDVRQVELAFDGSERIAELMVKEGDRIKPGQALAKLETRRFELAVAVAKAVRDAQKQEVAKLEAGSRVEEIAKARADLASIEAKVRDLNTTYKRYATLRKDNAVSQQKLDDAKGALDSAKASVDAFQAALDLVLAGPRKEDIARAKALRAQDESRLALAEHNLQEATLFAPSDGIVQDRTLEVGDMASPQKPVFTVALIDPLWVRAYVSEPDMGRVFEGMKATVITDSFPGKEYAGWIGFISPTAEFTPKPVETTELRTSLVYQVRVFVENPNCELRLGMPATVHIRLDQARPEPSRP